MRVYVRLRGPPAGLRLQYASRYVVCGSLGPGVADRGCGALTYWIYTVNNITE